MKSRKRLIRREKAQILKAIKGIDYDTEIEVTTDIRTYRIRIENGRASLPSGKSFEIDARHIC